MFKPKKVLCIFLSVLLLCGCTYSKPQDTGFEITDMLGRTVHIPEKIERVVCIGAGALRLYSYVGDLSKLVGVESCEYGFLIAERPYQLVNEELFKSLPAVGTGGPQGSANAEAIMAVDPDIIFSLYTSDTSAMDELETSVGVPVVVLSYGKTEAFDESINNSLKLIGKVTGRESRANEVCNFIDGIKSDLDGRTKDIVSDKTVYLGCQSKYGTHGIGSSTADYALFNAVNANNILDINGYEGYQKAIDLETLLTLNPDVIILDFGGLSIFEEEYSENIDVFKAMKAFINNEVYCQMPYNAYYTNLEIAYTNAYFIGKTLYPDSFDDIDIAEKLAEISLFMLGKDCSSAITLPRPLTF